jgi:hypothetical protein
MLLNHPKQTTIGCAMLIVTLIKHQKTGKKSVVFGHNITVELRRDHLGSFFSFIVLVEASYVVEPSKTDHHWLCYVDNDFNQTSENRQKTTVFGHNITVELRRDHLGSFFSFILLVEASHLVEPFKTDLHWLSYDCRSNLNLNGNNSTFLTRTVSESSLFGLIESVLAQFSFPYFGLKHPMLLNHSKQTWTSISCDVLISIFIHCV